MFTTQEYYLAWLIYLGGVVLMMGCWWYLTHFIRLKEIRHLLRIIVGVLLLVPWFTDPDSAFLAPAFIVATVDALTIETGAFWRAGTPLLIALIIAVVLSLVWQLWCWRRNSQQGELNSP